MFNWAMKNEFCNVSNLMRGRQAAPVAAGVDIVAPTSRTATCECEYLSHSYDLGSRTVTPLLGVPTTLGS